MAATASVSRASSIPDRLPVQITDVDVGVCYEPLRRLWPLLGEQYRLALLHEPVSLDGREGEGRIDEERRGLKISSVSDAEAAVKTIASVVLSAAVSFAEPYDSVERLLEEVGYEKAGWIDQQVVALLAAAGRFEEARAALARYRPLTDSRKGDREAKQFLRQVGRYIDSHGDSSIVPSEPPPSLYEPSEMPAISELWQQERARNKAVQAVRAMSPRTDRAELHASLERELTARGLTESPLWFEQTLDHLHDSRTESTQYVVKGVATAAGLAIKAIRALREHRPLPDMSSPAWLDPPARAAYPVPNNLNAQWAEVQLDDQAKPLLERAYAAIPRLIGSTATVDAWIDWNQPSDGTLAVSLGDRRIGILAPSATAAYRQVMNNAAGRDELPYVPARLTPRPSAMGYLLEVQLPD